METTVANLVGDGTRALAVVTGYFGDRLAQICERYGARVTRLESEWGRAAIRSACGRRWRARAPTSSAWCTRRRPPAFSTRSRRWRGRARARRDRAVDAVTSFGGQVLDLAAWGIDACYSCSQKCVGAPSGLSPVAFAPSALARRVPCRSFYFDLALLEDYWLRRKYHHTISASLVYALHEALAAIEEEGLEARWARHERHHRALARGLQAMGLGLLPPEGERLWTLNAVRVPAGVDEARVRRHLLERFDIEIGAGLGPLAGKIRRVGLMGASSTPQAILLFLGALEGALAAQGHRVPPGAGTAAAVAALDD